MRVVAERPPNWDEIVVAFPEAAASSHVIFAWGDAIYNPSGVPIDRHLMAHEALHGLEQHPREGGPAAWWRRYIDDPAFRVEQEVEAYRRQLRSFASWTRDRERVHRYAMQLAGMLASPIYRGAITQMQAYRRIKP